MGETSGQVYRSIAGRDLSVDLYRPSRAAEMAAVVVLVHGGGWVAGHRSAVAPLAQAIADRGYLVACPEYRLVREARWPAQMEDVSDAIRWATKHAAAHGVASGRVVVAGGSAGGHLALMATLDTLHDAKPAAVIAMFAASDLSVGHDTPRGKFDASALVGPNASPEALAAITPVQQLSAKFPPALILHGGADWFIDPTASINLYRKFTDLGVPAELHILAAANHEFSGEPSLMPVVAEMIDLFLKRIVTDAERFAAEGAEHNHLFGRGKAAFDAFRAEMAKKMAAQAPLPAQ